MIDVFAAFNIRTLSPSQLRLWAEDRGAWYAKHRAKIKEDAGPFAWRGEAIEAGLQYALEQRKGDPLARAMEVFDARADEDARGRDGEVHEKYDEAKKQIIVALPRALKAWADEGLPAPSVYQGKCEAMLPGCAAVPIFGKFDFSFGVSGSGYTLDLKTTKQLPSQPKDEKKKPEADIDHAIQASCYALARRENEARILYVSCADNPKSSHRMITLGAAEIGFYTRAAAQIVKQIETALWAAYCMTQCEAVSLEKALAELCRPNLLAQGGGTFPIWKSEFQAAAIEAVPAWGLHQGVRQ